VAAVADVCQVHARQVLKLALNNRHGFCRWSAEIVNSHFRGDQDARLANVVQS
jgi:hypothetical protein